MCKNAIALLYRTSGESCAYKGAMLVQLFVILSDVCYYRRQMGLFCEHSTRDKLKFLHGSKPERNMRPVNKGFIAARM